MSTPTKEQQLEALDRVANTLRLEASGLAVARKNELAMKEMFDAAEVLQHIRDQIASAELNQCDGCRTGFVLDGDMHRWADGSPYMICQRGRYYAPQPAPAAVPDALAYATQLARSLHQKHYAAVAPDWAPFDDLYGVLTQIDNMTTGLTAAPESPEMTDIKQQAAEYLEMADSYATCHTPDGWPAVRMRTLTCAGEIIRALLTENEALQSELDLSDAAREKMADLLTRTANALRGDPEPLSAHSWHDLPERAAAAVAAIDVMQRAAAVQAAVPVEIHRCANFIYPGDYIDGWNACRSTMLAAAPKPDAERAIGGGA